MSRNSAVWREHAKCSSQADQYTDGYLAALTAVDAYCTRLDNGMWKP